MLASTSRDQYRTSKIALTTLLSIESQKQEKLTKYIQNPQSGIEEYLLSRLRKHCILLIEHIQGNVQIKP